MNFNLKIEEINYIKFSYKGNDGEEIKDLRAIVKNYNDKTLIAYAKNQNYLSSISPQTTSLSFVCDDGIYKTQCTLKSIEIEEPYIIFIFEKPQNIFHEQNRNFFRIPAIFDCIYEIDEKEYKTKSIDISANGISLLMPSADIPKTFSKIVIFLNEKVLHTNVKYIRTEKFNEYYKYSFTFTQISEKDQDFISQFCFQKQLEKRRNALK